MSRRTLQNAIIQSFDNCIKDYKVWGLVHTLLYLEDASVDFDTNDYPYIKQEVINKALDVMKNPYTTKAITQKTRNMVKNLQVSMSVGLNLVIFLLLHAWDSTKRSFHFFVFAFNSFKEEVQ